jgi:hypothetical protein
MPGTPGDGVVIEDLQENWTFESMMPEAHATTRLMV